MDITAQLIDTIFSFSRCIKERMGVQADFATLSVVQLQTLVFLKKNTSSSMNRIADYLHVELPSATNLVEHLVQAKLVERKAGLKDKRLVNVCLTKKGETLLEQAKKQRKEVFEKVLTTLTENEKQQLLSILEKMTIGMEGQHEK